MRRVDIEAWGLRIIDEVARRGRAEDAQVECKGTWPEPSKAARQIAGLCNAARGAEALWIVGLDEQRGVVPVDHSEFADWWAAARTAFDGTAPPVHDVVVQHPRGSVVVLQFDTDLAPFVVRNARFGSPTGGPVEREVPWREANATRSARRDDLIRLLAPLQHVPRAELLSARLDVLRTPPRDDRRDGVTWSLTMHTYIVHPVGESVVIPFHQCAATVRLRDVSVSIEMTAHCRPEEMNVFARQQRDQRIRTVDLGIEQLIVSGPGYMTVYGRRFEEGGDPERPYRLADTAEVEARLLPAGASTPLRITADLSWVDAAGTAVACWRYDA
jgi:hypothetical protein